MIYENVIIARCAFREMIAECCAHPGVESGGVLVGRVAPKLNAVVVTNASDGGPMAIRRADMFARDTDHCQKWLNRMVAESGGQIDYVGEWHKHPTLSTRLSPLDEQTLRQIAGSFDYATDQPLFLVAAMPNEKAWRQTQMSAFSCFDTVIHEMTPQVK